MAKKHKIEGDIDGGLWNGIGVEAFENEAVEVQDIGDYNYDAMKYFIANISLCRQLIKVMDGLKPGERRLLYVLWLLGAKNSGGTKKSSNIVGETTKYHPHGDQPIYGMLVNMAQYWKKAIPLIKGQGNFASPKNSDKYGQMRYTEAKLTKFAEECYFADYDEDCVEKMPGSIMENEPATLPARYPVTLINGAFGIASGNKLGIPPYHVDDVYRITKALIENPNSRNIYAIPEFPCGCDILEEGRNFKDICETGKGTINMRARIEIEETKHWYILHVLTLPLYVDISTVTEKLFKLVKEGKLPIKDVRDGSKPYKDKKGDTKINIDLKIFASKNQDPYMIRNMLFKLTPLQSSFNVQFKVVTDNLYIGQMNMRDLVNSWLDERREYLRRLYNRRMAKMQARMSFLEALLIMLKDGNDAKVIELIKKTQRNKLVEVISSIPLKGKNGKVFHMNSFQAKKVAEMPISALNKTAQEEYKEEIIDLEERIKNTLEIIRSEKKIDQVILSQLEDMKKYGEPKKCRVITKDSDQTVADTNHIIIVTNNNLIKKLPVPDKTLNNKRGYGSFQPGDYPSIKTEGNNHDSMMFFDDKGRYSIIPISTIPNTDYNSVGVKAYDVLKLEGKIIYACPYISDDFEKAVSKYTDSLNFVSISKNGLAKRSSIKDLKIGSLVKNAKYAKVKDGDSIAYVGMLIEQANILIYTKKGYFNYISVTALPEASTSSQGLVSIDVDTDGKDPDEVVGCTVVAKKCTHIALLTTKGYMKKISIGSFELNEKRKKNSYITKLSDATGTLLSCGPIVDDRSKICVCTKSDVIDIETDRIKEATRLALPTKVVPVPNGDNIMKVVIEY